MNWKRFILISAILLMPLLVSAMNFWQAAAAKKRAVGEPYEQPFTLLLIPDTQYVTKELNISYLNSMLKWVGTNSSLNTAAILGLGDCIHDYANTAQFTVYTNAFTNVASIPTLHCAGNHDRQHDSSPNRDYSPFNNHITRGWYTNKSWWSADRGGFLTNNAQQNAFLLVTNGNTEMVVVTLEYGPATNTIMWASNVFATYPDHYGILTTHSYLMPDGSLNGFGDLYAPSVIFSTFTDATGMWEVIRKIPNLRLIVSGHQILAADIPIEANRLMFGDSGNGVLANVSNWQDVRDGIGSGSHKAVLKLLTVSPSDNTVAVTTFDGGALTNIPAFDYERHWITNYTKPAVVDGLVGHWSFDEGGGQYSDDLSGQENTATLTIGATWTNGYSGNAVWLTPAHTNRVTLGTDGLAIGSSFTLAARAYPAALPATNKTMAILTKGGVGENAGDDHNYFIGLSGGGISIYTSVGIFAGYETASGANVQANYATAISTGQWYHFALRYDDTADTLTLFLNGSPVSTNSAATTSPATNFCRAFVGQFRQGVDHVDYKNFEGGIDDVLIYSRALSDAEIEALAE